MEIFQKILLSNYFTFFLETRVDSFNMNENNIPKHFLENFGHFWTIHIDRRKPIIFNNFSISAIPSFVSLFMGRVLRSAYTPQIIFRHLDSILILFKCAQGTISIWRHQHFDNFVTTTHPSHHVITKLVIPYHLPTCHQLSSLGKQKKKKKQIKKVTVAFFFV